jgi:hypothetical protein
LDSVVVTTRYPFFFGDVPDDKTLTVELTQRTLSAFASSEKKQILLPVFQKTSDVVLVAFNTVVFSVFLDVRFLLPFPYHVPDWQSGLRAMEKELESAFRPEIANLKFLFETCEFSAPMLDGLARHYEPIVILILRVE